MKRTPLLELEPAWSEAMVAKALIHSQLFQRKLLIVPRCNWTGHESDLLAIHTPSLRLIDIEIKISRADLLADPKKDKWWSDRRYFLPKDRVERRDWPPKVWKHYYALPAYIWHRGKESLEPQLPQASGVILMGPNNRGVLMASLARRAKPNPKGEGIKPVDVMDLARLAGLRMWDALEKMGGQR